MNKEQFLVSFFSKSNELRLNYFVLGSYQSLPRDTGGSDIDIVVKESDFGEMENILFSLTKECSACLVSYLETSNARFYRILAHEWGVQIDIFFKGLCFKGVPYFPIENMNDDVIYHNNIVRALNEKQGYIIDYFKEVIHNGNVRVKYVKALYESFCDDLEGTKSLIESAYGSDVFHLFMENLSLEGLANVAYPLKKILREKITHRRIFPQIKSKIFLMKRLLCKTPGYVIAVEGTDGSGKSFIINSISPILNEAFHNGVVYNHLRPNWLPDLAVLLGRRKKIASEKIIEVVSDPHAGKQSGFVMSLVRWGWYMLDYTFGYMRKVWPQIHSKSKVFIFDRYYYEFYLDQKRSHVKLSNWVVRIGELFLPKPDLILCLGGDPKKIFARKPETSLEEVTRQTNALKDFCKKRKNAVWIDTTMKPEESVEAAMKAIMAVMGKRFKLEDIQ